MKFVLLYAVVLSSFLSCSETEAPAENSQPELTLVETYMADPEAVARGKALFVGSCADHCHTLTATESDTSFLFDCEWNYGARDEEIFQIVTNGIPETRMVGFGTNFPEGDADLWKIIAYIRTQQLPCD